VANFQFVGHPDAYPIGNEPIYCGDKIVGAVTSAAFSHTLGHAICLGYVTDPEGIKAGYFNNKSFSIGVCGTKYPVTCSLTASYDPKHLKVHQ